ncbi:beta-ketoacyl synthase N-terminal-like domain-containing protein [Stappia sp.]|uniref:beta-ketoacyl synthase N-terminal-like domain-containing protein n=1 Tax=Stappia sp. TaxID=1870903 RepID=UPI0032D8D0DB
MEHTFTHIPLNAAQERMAFLDARDPKRTDLNISCAVELNRPMTTRALHAALTDILPAFPFLNVRLSRHEGRRVWRLSPESRILIQAVLPEIVCRTEADLAAHYAAFSTGASDLASRHPWRVQLVRVEHRQFLLCSFHHAICDGDRSLILFLDALAGLGSRPDKVAIHPEIATPGEANWAAVARFAADLESPADLRAVFAACGAVGSLSREVVLRAEDRDWPEEQAAAAVMTALQAATANLLRDDQIVIGVPCDGVAPDSNAFGYFGTPGLGLVPPLDATPDDSAMPANWAVTQSRQASLIGGISYQDIVSSPHFETVASPERLFDVLLVERKLFGLRNDLVSRAFEPVPSRTPYLFTVNYWFDAPGDLAVRIETTAGLVSEAALDDLADRLLARLGGAVPAPRLEVAQLRDFQIADPGPSCPVRRFLDHATQEPDAPAILSSGAAPVSYGAVAERAGTLAAALRAALGEGPATVAFAGPRHRDEIIAFLATQIAGASFLRLDETDRARHAAQIEAAGVDLLIRSAADGSGADDPACPACFEARPCEVAGFRFGVAEAAAHRARPGDAYVVMTSGSTGEPKAIRFPVRQLARLIDWHIDRLPQGERMLQLSSLMHDVAFHEIFAALSAGRTLVFAGPGLRQSPSELIAFVDAMAVDRIYLPTVMLDGVARAALARDHACSALRMVIVAGGALTVTRPIRDWFARTGAVLANHYGMSETQDITANMMFGDPESWPDRPHAGRAIAGTEVRVVGTRNQPLPAGVVGQLAVGFADMPQERRMILGDIGYEGDDGSIHVLGRGDRVIKVRGFRLSLEAIEASLCAQDTVDAAAAVAAPPGAVRQDPWVFATGAWAEADSRVQDELVEGLVARLGPQARCRLVPLPELPRLKNGKTDYQHLMRRAEDLARAAAESVDTGEPAAAGQGGDDVLSAAIRKRVPGVAVHEASRLGDLGIDSLGFMELEVDLAPHFPRLTIADFFAHPTVGALRRHLTGAAPAPRQRPTGRREADDTVSVVGMAGRFPGAADVDDLWRALTARSSAIASAEAAGGGDASRFFVPSFGRLGDVDGFDHEFFGLSPAEAYRMDPQMRLFLELCWTAMEQSGDADCDADARVGLFAGAGMSTYLMNELEPARRAASSDVFREDNTLPQRLGNDRNYLTSAASYRFGFTGPSVTVQAACATSLVAVHYARLALLNDECDIAIAGGVSVIWPEPDGYDYVEGSVRSPNGRCRPFDAGADGTVFGNGGGLVVLKRTADATSYGNRIHAELLGSAVNHDGGRKMNFSAPSVNGQRDVVTGALSRAGLTASDLDFIEAHGTGTVVGDAIEWTSIGASLAGRKAATPCVVGSVKSNIGHLDEGAGIAGFIKACLSVSNRCFPGTCHFETLNPTLRANDHLQVSAENVRFDGDLPVTGGVSAFGMGGTNAHAIVRSPGSPQS